ncbi:hypothetical protein A3J02_01490 [Candidatus Azambacteria bacterium RIFCSPLOWO2_02_FULL_46_11]|uniref:Glycosyl transferase family 1 domain-containing protein n=2 Tax=Candidatus Azamiibacteriota TaxID=1752741 RepID=A0A1F5BFJ9_9BACT|nr:MAG: hypothetical protein A2W60_01830 [Candidatus Azambacteria bacterium RIFCSPHIGHO2_02_46_12]OGD44440.1 MAG: hypothetical protein A3J02_01490 [Candidatus Azambacteria bacterium RIFCSPLOWO2_02_FULL_46_11]
MTDKVIVKKNILIFSIAYLPFIGGAEVAVREITDRLGDFEFDMLTARLSPKLARFEKIGNVNVYRLGFGSALDKYMFPFAACLKALSLNIKRSYALSWAIMAAYAGFAGLFFKLARPKIPFLLTLQEGDPLPEIEKKVRFIRPIFKKIFLKADHIQAISNFLADWARKIGYKGALSVVPNGVDTQKFKIQPSSRAQVEGNSKFKIADFKEKLKIKSEERVIITVSRLVKKNGVEDIIKAAQDLRFKLLIIGKGEQEEYLKDLTKKLNLEDNVLFLGEVSHKDLPQYLWISDVFVRPSLSEGLGNAFLEAMAAGVPAIGTKVGGIPDFLREGETGLFCEVQNPKSITEKIKTLLKDENLRLRLIENGRKLVEEKYSWDFIALEMKNIFDKLI